MEIVPTDNTLNHEIKDEIVKVDATKDMMNIINLTAETLECSQAEALTKLAEVGIVQILNYPTGIPLLDAIMQKNNFPLLITKIKAIWNL